jgi:Protein of unknown function (DUF3307)
MIILLLFQVKHLICDFILQGPYQYLNKGKYGHPGGLLHIGIHAIGSIIVLSAWLTSQTNMWWLVIFEAIIHYHMDWTKVNICKIFDWKPTNSEYYWWLTGSDQFVHQITYIAMVALSN